RQRVPGGVDSRGRGPDAQGGTQGDALALAEEPREPGPQAERAGAAGGGVADEPAAGDGLLHERRLTADLGAAGQTDRGAGAGRLASARGSIVYQGVAEVRGDAGEVSDGHPGVLRLPHFDRAAGGDQQQDQDHATTSLRLPRPGVFQAEDPGPPRDQVRFSRMSQNKANLRLAVDLSVFGTSVAEVKAHFAQVRV